MTGLGPNTPCRVDWRLRSQRWKRSRVRTGGPGGPVGRALPGGFRKDAAGEAGAHRAGHGHRAALTDPPTFRTRKSARRRLSVCLPRATRCCSWLSACDLPRGAAAVRPCGICVRKEVGASATQTKRKMSLGESKTNTRPPDPDQINIYHQYQEQEKNRVAVMRGFGQPWSRQATLSLRSAWGAPARDLQRTRWKGKQPPGDARRWLWLRTALRLAQVPAGPSARAELSPGQAQATV